MVRTARRLPSIRIRGLLVPAFRVAPPDASGIFEYTFA